MAWQDEMVLMLRLLLNDNDSSPTYNDERLEQLLTLAAKYVQQRISFSTTYTISVSEISISPDPVDTGDDVFVNFVVLKAACLADWNIFRQKAMVNGLKSKLGPAVLETIGHLDGFKQLLDSGPCAAFEKLRIEYLGGNPIIRAVLSPFIGNSFDPSSLNDFGSDRDYRE